MIIKVCGMREANNIRMIEQLPITMMGFIFHPRSPRYINELPEYLPDTVKRVGVFVNEDINTVLKLAEKFSLNYIQLHGTETSEYCLSLHSQKINLIKAFSIASEADLEETPRYEGLCDYFLFDTKCDTCGGSGKSFDWSVLSAYQGKTPFLLSGGIAPESVNALKDFRHKSFAGIDLNSRFESMPGVKDVMKLAGFISELIK